MFVGMFVTSNFVRSLRPGVVADSSGVRRPWHRRRFIPWTEVESVAAPQPGALAVRLNLLGGWHLDLADIPATESISVALIGGKQLVKEPRLQLPVHPPGIGPNASHKFDIDERVRQLAVQRTALAAEARRLGGLPTDT